MNKFLEPEIVVEYFTVEDVITTSIIGGVDNTTPTAPGRP